MFNEPVLPSGVLLIANKLETKYSYGNGDISTKLLKQEMCINIIQPIIHIRNRSYVTGIVPNEIKIAKIMPIYKSLDLDLLEKYRPVYLLSAFCNLIKTLMIKNQIHIKTLNCFLITILA